MVKVRTPALAGAALLLMPLFGVAMADSPVPASVETFAPPPGPLVMTRTVWRSLSDGKQIVVRRTYAVHFVRDGSGYRLEGQLVEAQVDAPAAIAPLAELERKRPDTGMFPIRLDSRGTVLQAGQPDGDAESRAAGLRAGQALIGAAQRSAARKRETLKLMGQMMHAAPQTPWPTELFRAVLGEQHRHSRMALPTGGEGQVDVTTRISQVLPGGLAGSFERIVTTSLEGHDSTSREVWTFAPIAQPQS